MFNILVTGCGGDIGQSISKILRNYKLIRRIVGCDIHENHPGKFLCDDFNVVPRCSDANYLAAIEGLIKRKSIDFVISGSEPELRFFLEKGIIKSIFDKPIIMANQRALEVGFDKLNTVKFLQNSSLPFPKTDVIANIHDPVFPAILKSRDGSGSKQVLLIENPDDFEYYRSKYPTFILQEYLGDHGAEYTCGLFRSKSGICRNVAFRRTLSGGFSNFGVVEISSVISELLFNVAVNLHLVGSINVQLRMSNAMPIVFEINPRFSSTVLFRDLLGFRDLIWSIEDTLEMPISAYDSIESGRRFYKGFQEYYE